MLKVKLAPTPRAFQDEELFMVLRGPAWHLAGRQFSGFHAQPCPYISIMTQSQSLTL